MDTTQLYEIFSEKLTRGTISNCAKWAMRRRVMGKPFEGPWSFKYHPWLYAMHASQHPHKVALKGAQLGFTEWAINESFYTLDHDKLSVFYGLPTRSNASDFSSTRFNPALDESDYIKSMFTNTNNVHLKVSGSAALYIRGLKSRADLKSVPAAKLILDEYDEMPQVNIDLVLERLSGQQVGTTKRIDLSTPSVPGHGISGEYEKSNKQHYFFACPCCGKYIDLQYPRNLKVTADRLDDPKIHDSYVFCHECNGVLPFETRHEYLNCRELGGTGHFVAEKEYADSEGYYVNQLYASSKGGHPIEWARAHIQALTSRTKEQELWNSKAGLPHVVDGSNLEVHHFEERKKDYKQDGRWNGSYLRTMGVDVGSYLDVTILEWRPVCDYGKPNEMYAPKLLLEKAIPMSTENMEELLRLFVDYRCEMAVIDAEPEIRFSSMFVNELGDKAFMCDYGAGYKAGQVQVDDLNGMIRVNRTTWLDKTIGRIKSPDTLLPNDISDRFQNHFMNVVRYYKYNRYDEPIGTYRSTGPDHQVHSWTYAELALPLALMGETSEIEGLF